MGSSYHVPERSIIILMSKVHYVYLHFGRDTTFNTVFLKAPLEILMFITRSILCVAVCVAMTPLGKVRVFPYFHNYNGSFLSFPAIRTGCSPQISV